MAVLARRGSPQTGVTLITEVDGAYVFGPDGVRFRGAEIEWSTATSGDGPSFTEARFADRDGLAVVVRTWHEDVDIEYAAHAMLMTLALNRSDDPAHFDSPPVTRIGQVELQLCSGEYAYLDGWTDGEGATATGGIDGVVVGVAWRSHEEAPALRLQALPEAGRQGAL